MEKGEGLFTGVWFCLKSAALFIVIEVLPTILSLSLKRPQLYIILISSESGDSQEKKGAEEYPKIVMNKGWYWFSETEAHKCQEEPERSILRGSAWTSSDESCLKPFGFNKARICKPVVTNGRCIALFLSVFALACSFSWWASQHQSKNSHCHNSTKM